MVESSPLRLAHAVPQGLSDFQAVLVSERTLAGLEDTLALIGRALCAAQADTSHFDRFSARSSAMIRSRCSATIEFRPWIAASATPSGSTVSSVRSPRPSAKAA